MLRKTAAYVPAITVLVLSTICPAQENQTCAHGHGIWSHGDAVILFAASSDMYDGQMLASKDGGKTWARSGPELDGSEFSYVLDTGAEVWVAGEHIAEGPSISPFLLLYGEDDVRSVIYDSDAELLGIALEPKTGRFLAWVEHINFESADWSGPIYLHQSADGGRTWTIVKEVRRVPKSASGLRFFQKIPYHSGPWHISNLGKHGIDGFAVEHHQADGKWHRVSEFRRNYELFCFTQVHSEFTGKETATNQEDHRQR